MVSRWVQPVVIISTGAKKHKRITKSWVEPWELCSRSPPFTIPPLLLYLYQMLPYMHLGHETWIHWTVLSSLRNGSSKYMWIHVNMCVSRNTPLLSITVSGKPEWTPTEGLEGLICLEVAAAKIRSLVFLKVWSMMVVSWWLASQEIHVHGMTVSTLSKSD